MYQHSYPSAMYQLVVLLLALQLVLGLAPSGPWDTFNIAPTSRTVYPITVKRTNGSVNNAQSLVHTGDQLDRDFMSLQPGSWVTFDFGKEIGGWVSFSFSFSATSSKSESPPNLLQLAFTESPLFIGPISDDSSYPSANTSYDGALDVLLPSTEPETWAQWTMPREKLRGGFRYLTVVYPQASNTNLNPAPSSTVRVANLSVSIEFMPHWNGVRDLRDYSGYFYATGLNDAQTYNKAWYAGAYTVQTNTVPVNTGRQVPFVNSAEGWLNNATLTFNITRLSESDDQDPSIIPIIVDGAKRDRAVWPGDMGIAVPTQFVSTFDLLPTRNALSTMFESTNPHTGMLDESGPPLSQTGSDTYHMHTLIGTYNYWLYSGDDEWVQSIWTNYTKAVAYLAGRVDQTGLLDVGGTRDWARLGQGGHNSEANALYYRVLTTASILAQIPTLPNPSTAQTLGTQWSQNATVLQQTFNALLWDDTAGLYKDNTTNAGAEIHPQDGNSFALLYGITVNETQKSRISEGLMKNWVDVGAVAPELPGTVSPFITGFEVQAHFTAGNDDAALDLLNRTWGFMLNTTQSVQSTLLEGYTSNGSIWYRSADGYNFDPSYTSHSHGWSSGATSSLTFYLLGLQLVNKSGITWKIEPHPGSPSSPSEGSQQVWQVQGGFETDLGWFGVSWVIEKLKDASGMEAVEQMSVSVDVPVRTSGTVVFPGRFSGRVVVDGKESASASVSVSGGGSVEVSGGKHVVVGYAI